MMASVDGLTLKLRPIIVYGAVVLISAVLGASVALFSPVLLAVLAFLPLLFIVTWIQPALALLVFVAVLYGVIPPHLVPAVPVGGGKLQANDLALISLLLVVLLHSIGKWSEISDKLKALAFPIILLMLLFFISLIFSIGYFDNPAKHVLAEIRNFLYWLLLPIVVAVVVVDRSRYKYLINGIMLIGYVIASALVFQHLTGVDVLGSGRVEHLITLDMTSDVIRTTSPGIYLVILSIYLIVARWLSGKTSAVMAGLACIPLVLGVLVTFGRGVWIASVIGILLLAASFGRKAFWRVTIFGALGLTIMFGGLFLVKPESGQAIIDRAFSVSAEVQSGSSAEWRYLENSYAIGHLIENPLLGVGIGGFAHPKFHPMMNDDLLRYVHNGYLYLAVKIGILGLLVPIIIIWRVASWLRSTGERYDSSVLHSRKALIAVFFVPCITSFTQPEWMVHTGVGFFALVLGLILAAPLSEKDGQ